MNTYLLLLPLCVFLSCTSITPPPTGPEIPVTKKEAPPASAETGILTYCWRGNLEGAIPVQLQYQVEGDVVTGSIQYGVTKIISLFGHNASVEEIFLKQE